MLHNFSAGPSILPKEVLEKSAQAVLNFNGSGLSLLEISHRSKDFLQVITQAQDLALELSCLKDKGYKALFLHGGASMQFLMVAKNLLKNKAGYLDTGHWSSKAITEAQKIGKVEIVASSKSNNYKSIPEFNFDLKGFDYLHITTNNTIYGTQIKDIPKIDIPLVADMSSDIFSREIPYENFSLIYAGAQKNLGAASVALVILKEEILGKVKREIPSLLDYQNHIKNQNLANTPPVFSIYTCLENMLWIKNKTIKKIEEINRKKAQILYTEIDQNPLFYGYAQKEFRSKMNVVFFLKDEKLAPLFDDFWYKKGIRNLKGHRVLGGYRASIYNAMPIESVEFLAKTMREFSFL